MAVGGVDGSRRPFVRRARLVAVVLGSLALVAAGAALLATRGLPGREPASWLTVGPIAHRGDWTTGPERAENSLAAFDSAVKRQLAIELDVQLTVDGAVVVFHDEDLERMTGEPGRVTDMTLAEIQQRHLLGGTEAPPTLSQVLSLVAGRVPVFIEIKKQPQVGPLEDAVAQELAHYDGQVAVMSFNPFSMARVASIAPDVMRGQLSGDFEGEDLAWYEVFLLRNLFMNWTSRPDFIAMELDLVPSATTTVQKWWGRPLLCWTVEDAEDARIASRYCDAQIGNPGSR